MHGITGDADARQVVKEVAARNIPIIEVWVTDRGGTQPKTTPEAYRALIDEAHKHDIRVVAHATDGLADAKDLARAGLDGYIHGVLDADPRMDIRNTHKIARVYLQGREVDRAAMRKRWNPSASRQAEGEQLLRQVVRLEVLIGARKSLTGNRLTPDRRSP